jgi:hypothetical protein
VADLTRYAYDMRTGVLVGPAGIHPDPLNPGQFLEPAFTTNIAPPSSIPAGQVAVFSAGAWSLTQDNRGELWFRDRTPVVVDFLGDPTEHGLVRDLVLPPPPPTASCTRLGLMRAFSEMKLWTQVKTFIAADPDRQEQWDLATTLKLSDPIMVAAIQAFALSGITIDPVKLVTRANELVA